MINRNATTCLCQPHYYDNDHFVCNECPERYALCEDEHTPTYCQGQNRKSKQEDCLCLPGYVEDDHTIHCKYEGEPLLRDLHSYYPFSNGELRDVKQNSLDLQYTQTTIGAQDRNGLENQALGLSSTPGGEVRNAELKWNQNFDISQYGGFTVIVRNYGDFSEGTYAMLLKVVLNAGSQLIEGNFDTTRASGNLINNYWQTLAISFDLKWWDDVVDVVYFVDGQQIYTESTPVVLRDVYAQSITIGDSANNQINVIDDLIIYNRQLNATEISQIHTYATDLVSSEPGTTPGSPQDCEDNLKNLKSEWINIDFQMVDNAGILNHLYTIDFGSFQIIEGCYHLILVLGNPANPIYTEKVPHHNQVVAQFPNSQAVSHGCIQNSQYETECNFRFGVQYNGYNQITKNFTSILQTSNLDNIQNQLQLSVISDHSDQLKSIGANVTTSVNLCANADCSEYSQNMTVVRNEISYVELKIDSPEYQDRVIIHKSLKLDGKEFLPENLAEVQNWNQTGRIIYQIKPHIANQNLLLLIQIGLEQTTQQRRILQEQQQQPQPSSDMVGKQIFVTIIDKDDLKSEEGDSSQTGLILGVTLGSLAFVSFSISVVAFTILKVKKMALIAQAAKIRPVDLTGLDIKTQGFQQDIISNIGSDVQA